MNSIKNAIVTVTLLVVGYGSYVVLKEPNPTPFADSAVTNGITPQSAQAPEVDGLQPLGSTNNATAWNNNSTKSQFASQPSRSKISPPVGDRFDALTPTATAAKLDGAVPKLNSPGTTLQPPALNSPSQPTTSGATAPPATFQQPPLQLKQTPITTTEQPSSVSPFGNAMSNLSNSIQSAKNTASQQLNSAKNSVASRFEQAQTATQDAFQAANASAKEFGAGAAQFGQQVGEQLNQQVSQQFENTKSLGTRAKQALQTNLTPSPSASTPQNLLQQADVSRYEVKPQTTVQTTQSQPEMPQLSGAVGETSVPKLTTNVNSTFGQPASVAAEANPDQLRFEPAPSRFGKLQANDADPQKTRIEPPVAALAEPNSDIKPPFASELQNDNPFRKTITIDENQDQRPLVPRVEEWDPYVGPPLSASELVERNGTTQDATNKVAQNGQLPNGQLQSGQPDPQFGLNSQVNSLAEQNSASIESEATSIKVVEPGVVLPADATPMIANERLEAAVQPVNPAVGARSQESTTATFAPSAEFPAQQVPQTAPSGTVSSPPVAQPAGLAATNLTPTNVAPTNNNAFVSPVPNPVQTPTLDPAQAPIGNILPPAAAGNEAPPQPQETLQPRETLTSSTPAYPTTNSPAYVNSSVTSLSTPQSAQQPETVQPNQTFERVWGEVQVMLKNRDYVRALRSLTPWSSESNLNAEQNLRCIRLLDKLAGAIVYSRSSYLEPAYIVKAGETLDEIAALHAVPQELLAKINGIAPPYALTTGEKIKVVRGPFRASVSLSRRELTLFAGPNYAGRFKVKIGRDLPTDSAFYEVAEKSQGRAYFDRKLGREVIRSEAINRYGQHWLGLRGEHITAGHSVGIHARPKSETGDDNVGSISLSIKDAADVFSILSVGSRVEVRP